MDSEMLGRIISAARKQKNLSQKELGDLLNVSNNLNLMQSGIIKIIKISVYVDVQKILASDTAH